MGFFSFLRREKPAQADAAALYVSIVAQARSPAFYAALGAPDTVNGRFDLIVIHAMLAMRRLRDKGQAAAELSQALFDYMFQDMDRSLRELGVGDMGIGKHIKKMAKAFYGRAAEYETGLDGDADVLKNALRQNILRTTEPADTALASWSDYLRAVDAALMRTPLEDVFEGRIAWPSPGG